jgi:carboxyl-terminal processing protease
MTVTIAKYLTPRGRDIHRHGIVPDVQAKLSEQEAKRLQLEDLGSSRDSQYRVAENALVKQLMTSSRLQKPYKPGTSNLPAALETSKTGKPSWKLIGE